MYHIYTSYICASYCMCVDAVKCMCVRVCTWAAELLALDLPDSFVGEPSRAGAAGTARLDGIVLQVVCQPLQMAVTDKGVLRQVTAQRHTEHTKHIQVSLMGACNSTTYVNSSSKTDTGTVFTSKTFILFFKLKDQNKYLDLFLLKMIWGVWLQGVCIFITLL